MAEESKELTTEEQDEAGRVMLRAALDALGDFPCNTDEEDQNETARRVVRALAAAGDAETAEIKRLSAIKGERVWLHTEPSDAVATAFWMWSEQVDLDISEVAPASVIGARYLGFAQGLAAARAMTEALDLMEDGDMLAFSSRGAENLLLKTPNV